MSFPTRFLPSARRSLPSVLPLLALIASAGCGEKGQLVLGLATDLLASGQIDRVSMKVTRTGETTPTFSNEWVLPGVPAMNYRLPGSFTLFAEDGQEPTFEVVVQGHLTGRSGPLVERRSKLGVLSGKDLFVRLGITGSCEEVGCPGSLTCIEGQCKPPAIDLRLLPSYRGAQMIERLDCDSGTRFVDTSTGTPMPSDTSCGAGSICGEGTCLRDPVTLPSADPLPFVGGPAELLAASRTTPAFFEVGPIDAPRYHASATLLLDGRVLVVGGDHSAAIDGSARPVPGAVIYEPATASFRRLPDPPAALSGHTATLLRSGPDAGTVVFVGAATTGPAAFAFDPTTELFSSLPSPQGTRYFHTTSLLANGKLLVCGGTASNGGAFMPVGGAELYDPATRAWTRTKVGPVHTRAFHTATPLPDNRILMMGGIDMNGDPMSSVEAYDPSVDEFRDEIPMQHARGVHTATPLSDGTTLVVGGQGDRSGLTLEDVELYVPGGIPTPPQPEFLPVRRGAHEAVLLPGDRVLITGGATALVPPVIQPAGGAFLYDPAKRSFIALPEPKHARIKGFAVALADGDVLLGGGNDDAVPLPDGGVADAGLGPDMTILYCDPVANLGPIVRCMPPAPRCAIRGQRKYGPRVETATGPTCTADGSLGIGLACDPGAGDLGDAFDGCVEGAICLPDEQAMPRCLALCRTDLDCAGRAGSRITCARILTGPGTSDVGVCLNPCNVYGGEDCMLTGGGICRFALNQTTTGAMVRAAGACMSYGNLSVGQACTRDDITTECSLNELCISGRCEHLCEDQSNCDSFMPGSKCTGLAPAFPTTNGYCAPDLDMNPPPDMSQGT